MHEQVSDDFLADRDPGNHNRRDILVVTAIIGTVLLLSMAWWESTHPRPAPPTIEQPTIEQPAVEDPEVVEEVLLAVQEAQAEHPDVLLTLTNVPMADSVIFGDGTIVIDLVTGKVTLKNEPDAAAEEFWNAVEHFAALRCAP